MSAEQIVLILETPVGRGQISGNHAEALFECLRQVSLIFRVE
jgi:hypothetical protein